MLQLKIITPRKQVLSEEVSSVTVPSTEGDITVLPHHIHLLTMLTEGIITIRQGEKEDFLSIGGGYLETDGKNLNILVSRAYKQDELDEEVTAKALEAAKKALAEVKDGQQRMEASALLRRSAIDMKLIRRRKSRQA